jgi:hypothetical protein
VREGDCHDGPRDSNLQNTMNSNNVTIMIISLTNAVSETIVSVKHQQAEAGQC